MFSKETLDKVKLAKQYIENRYQNIMSQEKKNQQNWNKILSLIENTHDDLESITHEIIDKQNCKKRLLRQRDALNNYRLYNVIGKGAFGQVRLARNLATGEVVAIKRLQKSYLLQKKQVYNAYLERDFMIKNKSPFIVQMKSTFQDEDYLYIVMEYIQGGDLLHLLIERDVLTENETKFYVAELVLAIQQIHKMNYIHRDIKPDNILLDKNGHIKITDFGLSKYLELEGNSGKKGVRLSKMQKLKKLTQIKNKQRAFSKVGTPDYISPQVLTEKVYNHAVDLWGVGVIMFQCLYGFPPFTDQDSKEVCHKVANWVDYLEFPDDIEVSTSAKMLMLGLMNHSQKRLTIRQIKAHPFFTGTIWETIHKKKAPIIPKIKSDMDTSNFDEFQITNPWTSMEKQLIIHFSTPKEKAKSEKQKCNSQTQLREKEGQDDSSPEEKKLRQSSAPKFRFVGFNYRRIDFDPLENTAQILMRKSHSQNKSSKKILHIFNKGSSKKHLKTEQGSFKCLKQEKSHRPSIKKKLKSKKSIEKTRPSELFSTTNNISLNIGRLSTSKDLLRRICNQSSNKENHNKSGFSPRQSSKNNEKVDKIKQIYNSFTQKIKTKKMDYLQEQCKTHA